MRKEIHIVEKYKIWFGIALAILFCGIIVISIFGMNLGIDFTGGTILNVDVGSVYTEKTSDDIKKVAVDMMKELEKSENVTITMSDFQNTSMDTPNAGFSVKLMIKNSEGKQNEIETVSGINDLISKGSKEKEVDSLQTRMITKIHAMGEQMKSAGQPENEYKPFISYSVYNAKVRPESVTATASSSLILYTFLAVVVAVLLMLGYIWIRFELLQGIAAVVALVNSVLIMICFIAFFRTAVNATFIAAAITIVGYSINNTIIIFDRVRENTRKVTLVGKSAMEIANLSLKESMTRNINTTLTTIVTVIILFILGGTSIKEFAFPIIIGLLAGTYSSIFIAPVFWAKLADKRALKTGKPIVMPLKKASVTK